MNTRSEIHREELNIPLALLLGDEGSGVSDVILKACDQVVKIPMSSGAESLNVSVAAGIMIYEVMKQRI
jgi:23S rRNA (guanosine2251-2'-O)-methyltransferase